MNTANWTPDLFMKRMEAREDWTFFRSSEVPDLHHTYIGKRKHARFHSAHGKRRMGGMGNQVIRLQEAILVLRAATEM